LIKRGFSPDDPVIERYQIGYAQAHRATSDALKKQGVPDEIVAVPVLGFVILRLKVTSLETDDVPGNTEIRKHDPVLKIIVIRASLAFSLDGYIE